MRHYYPVPWDACFAKGFCQRARKVHLRTDIDPVVRQAGLALSQGGLFDPLQTCYHFGYKIAQFSGGSFREMVRALKSQRQFVENLCGCDYVLQCPRDIAGLNVSFRNCTKRARGHKLREQSFRSQ